MVFLSFSYRSDKFLVRITETPKRFHRHLSVRDAQSAKLHIMYYFTCAQYPSPSLPLSPTHTSSFSLCLPRVVCSLQKHTRWCCGAPNPNETSVILNGKDFNKGIHFGFYVCVLCETTFYLQRYFILSSNFVCRHHRTSPL